jgi:hypothetical protein
VIEFSREGKPHAVLRTATRRLFLPACFPHGTSMAPWRRGTHLFR